MSWDKVTLGDIASNIQTGPFGSQLHQSDYSPSGTPVVMPKDLAGGYISETSIARVSDGHVNRLKRHKIQIGDILYSRRGDVGRCAYATEKERGWLCGTGCLRVTIDTTKANPKFIFYQLQKPDIVGWVERHAIGSTMLNLNTSILSNVPVKIPSLQTQNRIADILSAYDDLIENNQKQIKLLEEAARRLYKEWFVDLRFPGHETAEFEDGLPVGWRYGVLSEISIFKRGKTITKSQAQAGNIPVVAGGTAPAYYHNEANTVAPVVTVSASGTAGFVRLYYMDVFASDCSFVDKNSTPYLFFVYCFLKENQARLYSLQRGTAQPHVYAKDLNSLGLCIPNVKVLERYSQIVEAYFKKVAMLEQQSSMATEARDRLLPKLMSGDLEV